MSYGSSTNKPKLNLTPKRIFTDKFFVFSSLFLIIIFSQITNIFQVINSPFDADEFQHLHIMWNIFNGKIIYKDFFEHHGPIYPFLNSLIFELFHLKPGLEVMYIFRFVSLIYSFAFLFLVYRLAKEFLNSTLGAVLSVAFFAILIVPHETLTQIRPDGIQNIFWLLAVLFLVINIDFKKQYYSFLCGLFLGLSVLTDAKAVICPAAIICYLVLIRLLNLSDKRIALKNIILIFSGFLFTYLIVVTYFIIHHAVGQFFFCNYEFNVIAALKYHSRNLGDYIRLFVYHQTSFVIVVLLGFFFFIIFLMKNKEETLQNKKYLLLFTISIITSLSAITGLYEQLYLVFLPFLSVVASFGVIQLYKYWKVSIGVKKLAAVTILVFTFAQLVFANKEDTDFHKTKKLIYQETLANYVLENSKRSEPVFFVWNGGGGYVFNYDLQYYWFENEKFRFYYKKIVGYNVYGEHLIKKLEGEKVKYIVGEKNHIREVLSQNAYNYVMKNYKRSKKLKTLWIRVKNM